MMKTILLYLDTQNPTSTAKLQKKKYHIKAHAANKRIAFLEWKKVKITLQSMKKHHGIFFFPTNLKSSIRKWTKTKKKGFLLVTATQTLATL